MVIIKIHRSLFKIASIVILVISLGLNLYNYSKSAYYAEKYEALACITSHFDGTNFIYFMSTKDISIYENKEIEIFDVNRGEVIKRIQINSFVNKEIGNYLNGITSLYVKVKAIPENGYIIRVPLSPPIKVKTKWLIDYGIKSLDEVFIIFPEQGIPYLLVLDNKKRPYFYYFTNSTEHLLKHLNFEPKPNV